MLLGEYIKKYRNEHGLTTRDFAKLAKMSQPYITMLEKGKNATTDADISPTLMTLSKLAGAMDMSTDDLIAIIEDIPVDISREVPVLSDIEKQLIARFRTLNNDEKRMLLRSVGLELPEEKRETQTAG